MFEFDADQHPVVMAADATDMKAGTFDRMAGAFTLGAPAAAASAALSVANTFLDITGQEQIDIQDAISGFDQRMGDYYGENKNAIDIVGFVGSSFVGGSLAVKGIQALRTGNATGSFGRALNFASSRRDKYFQEAMKELGRDGGNVRSLLSSAARRKSVAWEVADQAALGLAAEVAIVGTMYKNPVFDGDSYGDFAQNMALGAAISGGIGGLIGGVVAKGLLESASTDIQKVMRGADTVFAPTKTGLNPGTAALITAESVLKLSDDIKSVVAKDLNGKPVSIDISEAIAAAKDKAVRGGMQKVQELFNTISGGDAVTGQAYFATINEGIEAAKAAGKDASEITRLINGYLANVSKIETVDLDKLAMDSRRFYVTKEPVGETAFEKFTNIFSLNRNEKTQRTAYRYADDVDASQLVVKSFEDLGEESLKKAFRANPEVDAVRLPNGAVRINPTSKRVKRIADEPFEVKQYVHLSTGTVTPETVPVFGDIIGSKGVVAAKSEIIAGGKSFKQGPQVKYNPATAPIDATARWAWAAKQGIKDLYKITEGTIEASDFPVLRRITELANSTDPIERAMLDKFKLKLNGDILEVGEFKFTQDFAESVMRAELFKVMEAGGKVPSSHVLSAQLNTTLGWVEESLGNGMVSGRKLSEKAKLLATDSALAPQNVMVTWDFRNVAGKLTPEAAYELNMGPGHIAAKELTKEYQWAVQDFVGKSSHNVILGQDAEGFQFAPTDLSKYTEASGAGAGTLTASNAGYGEKAKLWVQNTGKQVELVTQKRRDAVVETLSPYLNKIKDRPESAADLGIVTNMLRLTPHPMVFETGYDGYLFSREMVKKLREGSQSLDEIVEEMSSAGIKTSHHVVEIKNTDVYDFLKAHAEINAARRQKFNVAWNAMGHAVNHMDDLVAYVPPIDTVRRPYVAYVKTKKVLGLADDVGMLTARTEQELRTLMAGVGDDFDVFTKTDGDNYFKAKGQYEYGLTMNESRVNSELMKRGKLGNFQPEMRYESVATDYLQWHARQEESLVRAAVQVGNRKFFSELEFLSSEFRKVAESQSRGIGAKFRSKVADPFGDYIKTSLNISKQSEFPLLDSLNETVDKLGVEAGRVWESAFHDAKSGVISWEEASEKLQKYGHGGFYKNADTYYAGNEPYAKNLIRGVISRVNSLLAGTTLRLDFANSLVNMISTPIMLGTELASIKRLVATDSVLAGQLKELTSVAVPGTNGAQRFPSTTKLLYNAINNYFGKDKEALIKRYRDIGSIKDISKQYYEMLDDLAFRPDSKLSSWLDKVEAGIEKGSKFTGNVFSEEITRFVSADVMKQLTDPLVTAGKMDVKSQNAYISTFVNRVQGNYVASQRPVLFQGTTGAAIGLFQTYAFNVLQQLHRHMKAGDKKTLATFGGLQTMIFGMNGLPFFDAINSSVVGSYVANNPEHKDLYSVLPGFNKEMGDWILYGSASAFPIFTGAMPALYSRGDINPRHISIVPINPIDIPAVQASIKLASAVAGFGKNVVNGVDLGDAMLQGLEHQGWNRPLAGLAQTLSGKSTTATGSLISASNEMAVTSMLGTISERAVDFGGVSRVLGARPMDEAVALQQLYRIKQYQALDRARIERLGSVVKSKLYDGAAPTDEEYEDFALRYARSGGRIENFNKAMQRWMRDANVSVVNQMVQKTGTPYSQRLFDIMGGQGLEDYRTATE